jgi:hypothetical protein
VPVSVVANVNLSRREGKILFVNPLPAGKPSVPDAGSEVVLRALDEAGRPIRELPVQPSLSSELAPDDDRVGLVDAVFLLPGETRAIQLSIGGQVVDTVRVGGSLPPVRGVLRMAGADDRTLRVGLALERTIEEGHTYAVQVSGDHGRTWSTVAVGLTEPTFELDKSQFRQGDEVQVRVIATNGLSSTVVSTETFRI